MRCWRRPRWNRIQATIAPGVAAQQAPGGEVAADGGAVPIQGVQRVARAAWLETTRTAQPWAQEEAVGAHRQRQHATWPQTNALYPTHVAAPANTAANSRRAASRNRTDAALGNSRASNGERKRINHRPGGNRLPHRSACARICLLSRLRATARRAWRLGTTIPNHQRPGSLMLSTEWSKIGAPVVDIS
jgi:hypothetical protein